MNIIPWEKNGSGHNTIWQNYDFFNNKIVDSCFLKTIAYAKMWEPAVISACFQGTECVFDPSVTLLLESKDRLNLYSVCQLSYADEGKAPNLLLRSSEWNSKDDCEKFDKAQDKMDHLLSDKQLTVKNVFIRDESYGKLNQLIADIGGVLLSGLRLEKCDKTSYMWHNVHIKCEHRHEPLTGEVSYCPLVLENPAIEKWFLEWQNFFETEKIENDYKPDGDIRISYGSSLPEMLNMR